MQEMRIKAVCFSPTGTTHRVVEAIVAGMSPASVDMIDITGPETRQHPLELSKDEVLVIGVPVYMGRVPALLDDWLGSLRGQGTPAVCVVVYGNRAYENALLELCDVVSGRGCVPLGGGAFIGEHSFSGAGTPTAEGRPDASDLNLAREFGHAVQVRLDALTKVSSDETVKVPGEHPYGGVTELWDVDFIEVGDQCQQCGLCAEICPMGAIDPNDSARIDPVKCITCCACIKRCPQAARAMKPGPVMDARKRLHSLYSERKEPEVFL